MHLLAIRPVSEKFLGQKTRCSPEECLEVLHKVGKPWRLDSSKWELSDRGYKDLDLWKFSYPSQDDRQMAIDNAIKAFDRMRLSRANELWQLLLPKEERGMGKILSKLNLHEGPIQKSSTPRIHVQQHEDGIASGYGTGNESDSRRGGLVPSGGEDMVRSKSHESIKKTKVSEKEAQSKRLLSKNPRRATQASKAKETKAAPKKDVSISSSKVKSAEFVRESDEDSPMEDVVFTGKSNKAQDHPDSAGPTGVVDVIPKSSSVSEDQPERLLKSEPSASVRSDRPKDAEVRSVPSTSSLSGSSVSSHRYSDASQSSASDQSLRKAPARPRKTSSPHKPSPLGSSPPTNASDFENDGHSYNASSSSSPLILQAHKGTAAPTPDPATCQPGSTVTQPIQNHTLPTLKRKADSIETDLPSSNPQATNSQLGSNKRQQSSAISPPPSDSSSGYLTPNYQTLMMAKRFKGYHAKYEKLYRELSNSPEPAQEQVKKVIDMHNRLTTMKMEIARAASVS